MSVTSRLRGAAGGTLSRADAAVSRLYGWRGNPLYQSGTIAVWSLVVLLATGLYLLLFYRIGAPYASVERITAQAWTGRWIRTLHRYASDLAVVAVAVHALRMFAQGRSWGPRLLAWVSGVVLTLVLFVCGWTGYVMVWDVQALVLAEEGARFMDALPIFGEPIGRAFTGERAMPSAFFFLNLFAHVALPVGIALLLWVHVSKVARPALLPPRGLGRALLWGGLALSVAWPISMAAPADSATLPDVVPLDLFYAFWLPVTRALPAWAVWAVGGGVALALLAAPRWTRPPAERVPPPSVVDERLCTGCTQCTLDCPWEAIAMVPRQDGREGLVALVDPALCVSCGICAGSCAPMGVGPPGRTGRDQLDRVRAFLETRRPGPDDVVLVACDRGAGGAGGGAAFQGASVFPVACAGNLHTSVIEVLVRSGAGGVLVASCPQRDCWNREGVKWLEERVHHDREAELQARVDRRRVRLVQAGAGERAAVATALEGFREEVRSLARAEADAAVEVDTECDPPATADEGPLPAAAAGDGR